MKTSNGLVNLFPTPEQFWQLLIILTQKRFSTWFHSQPGLKTSIYDLPARVNSFKIILVVVETDLLSLRSVLIEVPTNRKRPQKHNNQTTAQGGWNERPY